MSDIMTAGVTSLNPGRRRLAAAETDSRAVGGASSVAAGRATHDAQQQRASSSVCTVAPPGRRRAQYRPAAERLLRAAEPAAHSTGLHRRAGHRTTPCPCVVRPSPSPHPSHVTTRRHPATGLSNWQVDTSPGPPDTELQSTHHSASARRGPSSGAVRERGAY